MISSKIFSALGFIRGKILIDKKRCSLLEATGGNPKKKKLCLICRVVGNNQQGVLLFFLIYLLACLKQIILLKGFKLSGFRNYFPDRHRFVAILTSLPRNISWRTSVLQAN